MHRKVKLIWLIRTYYGLHNYSEFVSYISSLNYPPSNVIM